MAALDCSLCPAPPDLNLSNAEAHVWHTKLDQSTACVQRLAQTLSMDEWARARRIHSEVDRKRFIVGRGVLRRILGLYLRTSPSSLQFCYGPYGKPALAEMSMSCGLEFNVSHSEGFILYALTLHHKVGVDLERIRPIGETEQIVERYFSVQERAEFYACPQSKRQVAFFNAWTRKEAYLKAIGEGLVQFLDQIVVSLAPGEPAKLLSIGGDTQEAFRWSLYHLAHIANCVAAVAVEDQGWRLVFRQWLEE